MALIQYFSFPFLTHTNEISQFDIYMSIFQTVEMDMCMEAISNSFAHEVFKFHRFSGWIDVIFHSSTEFLFLSFFVS